MPERWRPTSDAWCVIAYAVLAAVFWAPILCGGATLYFDDTNHWYYPIRSLCYRSVQAGQLPLWTPLIQAGYPLPAEGQSGLWYPPQLLFWVLPTATALSWTVWLHTWLAGAMLHGLARCHGARPQAALIGGLAYMLSGAFVGHLVYLPMAFGLVWLPAACWGVEAALLTGRARGFVAAGMALALALTAVHAQLAAYAVLVTLGYGVLRLVALPQRRGWAIAHLAGAVALAVALAAVQLLPLAELLGQTERGAGLDRSLLTEFGLSPLWLLFLFMPRFFGHPTLPPLHWADVTVTWELNAFFGVTAVVLALLAPLLHRGAAVRALAAIWWLTFVLAWGRATPLFGWLHSLPIMQSFRIPARWLMPGTFAGATLAALAAEGWLRDPAAGAARVRKAAPALLATMVVLLMAAWLAYDWGRLRGKVGPAEAQHAALAAAWFTGCWLAGLLILSNGSRAPRRLGWLAALLAVELFAAQRTFNPVADPSVFRPDRVATSVAAELAPSERVFVPPYASELPFLKPSSNVLAGVASIENFAPLRLARIDRWLNRWKDDFEPRPSPNRRAAWLMAVRRSIVQESEPMARQRLEVLRRLRVRLMLARYGLPGASEHSDGLWAVPGEPAPAAWQPGTAATPALTAVTGAREVVAPVAAGVVVVNGTAYPGWHAYRPDGTRVRTLVVEDLFRAARVEQPAARVTFVFEPFSLRLGLFCSLLALAGLSAGRVARLR